MPIATARSRSCAKVSRMMDSVAGIIMAAPTASSTRAAISGAAAGEYAAASEATPNTTSPIMNSRLWPSRSPSVPMPSSRPDTTRPYTFTIHNFSDAVTPSSCVSRGRAVYSTVMSTTINNKAMDTMPSTSQRRGSAVATAFE